MSILAQDFPFDSINKSMYIKQIRKEELVNNKLYLQNILPGDVIVIDNNNKVVNIPQIEYNINSICLGINLDFTGYDNLDNWKIRYFNMNSLSSTINIEDNSLETLMKLSLIFN